MNVIPTEIPEVLLLEPEVISDERGCFIELWHRRKFTEIGIDYEFVQDNYSRSVKHTLRGLHYQIVQPQGKLVLVTAGEIYDVAVDIRKSSPTFGQWVGTYLSAENRRMIWMPPGFCHGFYVTDAVAEVRYKCSDYYAPAHERCVQWNDPELAIEWPLNGVPLLSERDRRATPFARADYLP
jgi:dTDP-4-dehydrorhamnose 3,5-epimerase